MEEALYRIEELSTNGWHLTHISDVKLTKDRAKERINQLINEGTNPDRLRVQREV